MRTAAIHAAEAIAVRALEALDNLADREALSPADHVALVAQVRNVIDGHVDRMRRTYGMESDDD